MSRERTISNLFSKADTLDAPSWPQSLEKTVNELNNLSRTTEKDFLLLGERLQDFYSRTDRLSKLSSSVVSRLAGDEMNKAMKALETLFTDIKALEKTSQGGSAFLESILKELESMQKSLETLDPIARKLRALSTLIKVESARLNFTENGFRTVAEDVAVLVQKIEMKSETIMKETITVRGTVKTSHATIAQFEEKQRGAASVILDNTFSNLDLMRGRHAQSLEALKAISGRWQEVSRDIGEVVSSMQFHDITRQRIEHVHEALFKLIDEKTTLSKQPDFWDRIGRLSLSRRAGSRKNQLQADHLSLQVCELQNAQLVHTRSELVAAVERITTSLGDIAGHVGSMTEDMKRLAGAGDSEATSFVTRIKDAVSSLLSSIMAFNEINQKVFSTVRQVADTVHAMSPFISDVQKIGIALKMIALNSCVHAARYGDSAAGLGVLADAILLLSSDTEAQTAEVSQRLQNILAMAHRMSPGAGDGNDYERTLKNIDEMIEPLTRLDDDIVQKLHEIQEAGGGLSKDIDQTVRSFDAHIHINEQIRSVNRTLDEIIISLRKALPDDASSAEPDEQLKSLASKYTMSQERDIHESLLRKAGGGVAVAAGATAGAAVEEDFILFEESPKVFSPEENLVEDGNDEVVLFSDSPSPPPGIQKEEENLGDNIEMF